MGPQVRFCERCGGAIPRAYSTASETDAVRLPHGRGAGVAWNGRSEGNFQNDPMSIGMRLDLCR